MTPQFFLFILIFFLITIATGAVGYFFGSEGLIIFFATMCIISALLGVIIFIHLCSKKQDDTKLIQRGTKEAPFNEDLD